MEGGIKKAKNRKKGTIEDNELDNTNRGKRVSLQVKIKKSSAKKQEKKEIEPERYLETNFYPREEREKSMLMWSGVIFFMAIIALVWVFTFKSTFKTDESKKDAFNWNELNKITDDLSKNFDESKKQFQTMKEALTKAAEKASSTQTSITTSTETVELTSEEINLLKSKIIELEKATTTKKE